MLDVKAALDACFVDLSREFDIEEVDVIPSMEYLVHVRVWKVQIPALVAGKAEDVEVYILFPYEFPYVMPCVIILDERFKYLPHISLGTHKLCLYDDGVIYDANNIEGMVRDNISKARKWVERYYGCDNASEYSLEVRNYWNEKYENETNVDDYWILTGDIPAATCEMKGVAYAKKNLKDGETKTIYVVSSDEDDPSIKYIRGNHNTKDIPVLFLSSFSLPPAPPYSMTGQNLINCIADSDDIEVLKKFINNHGFGYILFSLGLNYALGGVHIYGLKVNRHGFRKGVLRPFDVMTRFENKNKNLDRLHLSVYNKHRIAHRTSGELMAEKSFMIAGLGSVGSNLCYYLNGYNNARFILADKDWLTVDNIGRHLLGFESVSQYKSFAVANYLCQYRPDREAKAYCKSLQQMEIGDINASTAVFVCTGDVMSERWLIDKMEEGVVNRPAFLMWLEAYGISGIMIYVNPDDKGSLTRLKEKADNCFMDYSIIKREEYDDMEKLTQRDAGCNGSYALYSANDVTMFLSAMFSIIDQLLDVPSESKCYRWVGNLNLAKEKSIKLVSSSDLSKGMVEELTL